LADYTLNALLAPRALVRLGIIGVALLGVASAFAGTAGLFSPGRLDQARLIDTFEQINGPHPGFRRNHAKGLCFTGWFDSNGSGAQVSYARVFERRRIPVFGRFALAGGMPAIADGPGTVRSLAVNFALPDGEVWRSGMIDIPVFPVRDAQGFEDQMLATKPGSDGHPDPARVAAFLAAHPETARAFALIKQATFSSGFANATYNGLITFRAVDAAGKSTPVRWSLRARDAFEREPAETPKGRDYLFDALAERLGKGPVEWSLLLVVGQPGDPTNDATLPWPADRQIVDTGTLSVTGLQSEAAGNCRDVNFDPAALPSGLEPSDDPLLSARSATYSVSFTRRAGERKMPSEVQINAPPANKGR
jgi:catalase